MELTVWRLVKEKYADQALDGEGARRFGGRWNARGTPVVYLSSSLSLAALELFVHLTAEDARLRFSAIPIGIPSDLAIQEVHRDDLPELWRSEPPSNACKAFGRRWAEAGETALLKLPSIIVPRELNYVVNPKHSDVLRLTVYPAEPFGFDSRMWK